MRQQVKHTLRRCLAALMLLACVLALAPETVVLPSSAVTQEEINSLKNNASDLRRQQQQLQQQLKEIANDKSKALERKRLLEQQINATQAEIDNISDQIAKYDQLIAQKEADLAQTQQKEQEQYELFCRRVREMEEEGEVSYWSILFSSSDFADLLDRFMMIEEIMEYDNGIMESLLATQQQLEEEKADLEQSRVEQEQAKQEQEQARAALKSQQNEVNALIKEISGKEDELEKAEKALQSAAAAVDAEIKRKEQELAAQITKVASESGYLWPLPASYNTLSSLFAGRIHPITGKKHNHTGIDIPAPAGTSIYAAKSGVVTTSVLGSGSAWSYGNYVVVSHSDGTSTLYAHMSRRNVTEGQTVKQGDVVGYVGTTGSSTGNHLHFEVRVNGTRTNPTDYFKDKTLYVQSNGKKVLLEH